MNRIKSICAAVICGLFVLIFVDMWQTDLEKAVNTIPVTGEMNQQMIGAERDAALLWKGAVRSADGRATLHNAWYFAETATLICTVEVPEHVQQQPYAAQLVDASGAVVGKGTLWPTPRSTVGKLIFTELETLPAGPATLVQLEGSAWEVLRTFPFPALTPQ